MFNKAFQSSWQKKKVEGNSISHQPWTGPFSSNIIQNDLFPTINAWQVCFSTKTRGTIST